MNFCVLDAVYAQPSASLTQLLWNGFMTDKELLFLDMKPIVIRHALKRKGKIAIKNMKKKLGIQA
jgi:hypothetical protein